MSDCQKNGQNSIIVYKTKPNKTTDYGYTIKHFKYKEHKQTLYKAATQ